MSEKRFFGFTDFSNWVRGQVATLSEYLNLKLGEADTRLGEMDTKLLNKANQSDMEIALADKLDVAATATDSALLGGQSPDHFATSAAVTQLESEVSGALTELTAAFTAGADKINAA